MPWTAGGWRHALRAGTCGVRMSHGGHNNLAGSLDEARVALDAQPHMKLGLRAAVFIPQATWPETDKTSRRALHFHVRIMWGMWVCAAGMLCAVAASAKSTCPRSGATFRGLG